MTAARGEVRTEVVGVQTATRIELLTTLASTGLQPQRFVASAAAWPVVQRAALDASQILELVKRRGDLPPYPSLEKMWAEAIYENIRQRRLPGAPSRLDCLYAVQVGHDAFEILPELGLTTSTFGPSGFPSSGPVVIPAHTRGRWVALDMCLFKTSAALTCDLASVRAELETLERLAGRYWSGAASGAPITELLCDGLDVDGWAGYRASTSSLE